MSQDEIIDLTGESSSPAPAPNGLMHTLPTAGRSDPVIDLSELPEIAGSHSYAWRSEPVGLSGWTATPVAEPISVAGSLDHVPPAEQHAVAMPHSSTATIEIAEGSHSHHTVTEDAVADEQVLLMLVGLVGAGKVSRMLDAGFHALRLPCRDARADCSLPALLSSRRSRMPWSGNFLFSGDAVKMKWAIGGQLRTLRDGRFKKVTRSVLTVQTWTEREHTPS